MKSFKQLDNVNILLVIKFLEQKNWQLIDKWVKPVSVWQAPNTEKTQILLPENSAYKDYSVVLWRALNEIAQTEHISLSNLIETVSGKDVLKIRIIADDVAKGHIPLVDGQKLFTGITELLQNTVEKAVKQFDNLNSISKREFTQNYLNQIELGQTEVGSYAVNIITPNIQPLQQNDLFTNQNIIQKTLYNNLNHFLQRIKEMEHNNDVQPFSQYINNKQFCINTKFCQALLNISGNQQRNVEINFLAIHATDTEPMTSILIEHQQWQPIQTAKRFFQGEQFMYFDQLIIGEITDLHRDAEIDKQGNIHTPENKHCRITLLTIFKKQPRKISIELNEEDYKKAITAHDKGEKIKCLGDLTLSLRRAKLTNIKLFDILHQETLIP